MGVLKTITDEYFGDSIRKEDEIDISGLDVEIVSFTDKNGIEHRHGYRVKDDSPNKMVKTLKKLIERIIEKRGNECSLNDIDVSNQKKMCYENKEDYDTYGVFYNSPFNGDISGWDVSRVENMELMFYGAKSFNQDISGWDVSSVKYMSAMFSGAESFNQPLDKWDVSNVEYMRSMFYHAKSFNQPLDNWKDKLSKVKNMDFMFEHTLLEKNNNLPDWYTK